MKNLTLIALTLALAVFSCKKDDDTSKENVPLIKSRVISYPDHTERDTTIYEYDSQGKVTKIVSGDGDYSIIEYSSSKIIGKWYDIKGVLQGTETYTLNAKGWIAEYSDVSEKSGSAFAEKGQMLKSMMSLMEGFLIKYFYDDEGHVIKTITSGDASASTTYTDTTFNNFTGDNLTQSVRRHWENGVLECDTTTYEYYTDKPSTIGMANYGCPYDGKPLKNPIKKRITKYWTMEFEYEYDAQNRIVKETEYNKSDVEYSIDYTYVEK